MTIMEYTKKLAEDFSKIIEKPTEATVTKKNNGVVFHGVRIKETETIDSVFYINQLYDDGESIEEAVLELCNWFDELKGERLRSYNWMLDFEQVQDKLCYKLVNKEKNQFIVQDYVCEEFLDLLKVYIININDLPPEISRGSVMVHRGMLEMWNVSEDELKEMADNNAENIFTCNIDKMGNVMKRIVQSKGLEMKEKMEEEFNNSNMWIMTNQYNHDGAACMCYESPIKEFSESQESDIYILPSSIHELILIPVDYADEECVKNMVRETNNSMVLAEEILSDNVYIYRREAEQIEIVL